MAASGLSPAPAFATDEDSDYLPWKIAFRVQFQSEKLGLRFHPAQFPDTGNGVYTIRLLELNKGPDGKGPAINYNASLRGGQEHLTLRPGLYLTHIGDHHLVDVPCEDIIRSLQTAPRPVTLRFVDVEAGVVTPHELRDSLQIDTAWPTASSRASVGSGGGTPRAAASTPTKSKTPSSPSSGPPIYKIILLGTTGVGKSSLLSVAVNGDRGYEERRVTTLEAEFGSLDLSDDATGGHGRIKARIWDTAGQERYRAITRSHYRRADGALLVYDMAEPESFDRLGEWLHALRETAGDSLAAITVAENKIDQAVAGQKRPPGAVDPAKVAAFCQEQELMFARTTAKRNAEAANWENGQRILDVVTNLVVTVHERRTTGWIGKGGDEHAGATPRKSGATRRGSAGGRLVLTDAGGDSDARSLAGDCGACGRS